MPHLIASQTHYLYLKGEDTIQINWTRTILGQNCTKVRKVAQDDNRLNYWSLQQQLFGALTTVS